MALPPERRSPEGVQQPEEVRIMPAENAETGKNPLLFCGIGEKLNPQHPERPQTRRATAHNGHRYVTNTAQQQERPQLDSPNLANQQQTTVLTPRAKLVLGNTTRFARFRFIRAYWTAPRFTLALPVRHLFTGQVLGVRSWFSTASRPLHPIPQDFPSRLCHRFTRCP